MTLRQRLRRPRRLRRQGRADRARLPRGRSLSRARRCIIAYSHCIAHGYDLALRRRAAEAGRRAPATGRSTASTRAASPQGESPLQLDSAAPKHGLQRVRAQRDPLPHGRAAGPGALPAAAWPAAQQRRRHGASRSTSNWRKLALPGTTNTALQRPIRRSDAMDLSTTYLGFHLPHPLMPGASPLVDDLDTVQAPRGRRRRRHRHALALRGADHRASSSARSMHMELHAESFAEALSYFPQPGRVRARARAVPRADPPHQGGGRGPGDRLAERRDAGGLARVRAPDRAGRRRCAGAERLLAAPPIRRTPARSVERRAARHRPHRQGGGHASRWR